ncbi:MAG: cbb3-type cytochrome c oxidase subunit I [Candidatus Kapaibacterium sp.]
MNTTTNKNYTNFFQIKTKHKGLLAWLLTTDHKRIGIMYLVSILSFFLLGLTAAFMMRLEMLTPGQTISFIDAQTYNSFFTLHGMIMVFLFIIPGIPAVFGNFFLPLQIGADDVAFPRINLLSYYLYLAGAFLALYAIIFQTHIDTGWTFYVPYSLRTGTDVTLPLIAAFILGFSSIVTGLNFITTIHRMRIKGMTMFQMPLFSWSLYSTAWIQVLATPIIGITIVLVLLERTYKFGIFDPTMGGDPVLYQHLFWIYSHPAVYIMAIPAFGVISDVVATFSRKSIFGYKVMAYSTMSIAFIGYLVWAHHMFTSGMSDTARTVFSFLTFFVAIPTGVKVFNWVATLWRGTIVMSSPMLMALSAIFLFSIGGLTGLHLGSISTDVHLHDTYFVIAHFHYVIIGGILSMFIAAMHFWFPKMFGRMHNEKVAKVGVVMYFIGANVLYFPMFIMGYMGMPRRYFDYLPEFQIYHVVSTVGSWILITAILLMFTNLLIAIFKGKPAGSNPWGAKTLEWTMPSPPPLLNFIDTPVPSKDPYDYSDHDERIFRDLKNKENIINQENS